MPSVQATVDNAHEVRRVPLPTGDLEVRVTRSDLPLEDLCDFAARRNPRRGFLFVSKVLGRHLPARPSVMRDVHRRLAEKIPADLPGPVAIVGLAETAICLGQGVHSWYLSRTGRGDVLFIHTTRHRLDHRTAFGFLEEHSHASQHFVYIPEVRADQVLLREARSAVFVDDEVSTGGTLVNLARAFSQFNPRLERVLCLTLTDWRGPKGSSCALSIPAFWGSLLEGEYRFLPLSCGQAESGTHGFQAPVAWPRRNNGRLGLRTPPALPARIAGRLRVSPGDRVLVLGTGEFCYLPFRLAEWLEEAGCETYCQATTRSPVLMGHAIRRAETFPDVYRANFLYNVEPESYDRIFLCSEGPVKALPMRLIKNLGAVPLVF